MKIKLIHTIFFLLLTEFVFSQNEFFNSGAQVTVQNNGLIFVQGEVVNTDNTSNTGLISNSGTITLSGNWTNNSVTSALIPTTGLVQLNGAFQTINGTNSTTFNNLTLQGTNSKQLNINTIVGGTNGVLNLTSRPFILNSNTLTVTNSVPAAIVRTTGYIESETPFTPGYGVIDWQIKNTTGNYEFPFGTIAGNYIPFFYNVTSAGIQSGIGSISASTYPTNVTNNPNNRPLPNLVTNLINNCNTEHAIKTLDRYWVINANAYSAQPINNKLFSYTDNEWNTSGGSTNTITENLLKLWHYNTSSNNWQAQTASSNNQTTNLQTSLSNTLNGNFMLAEYRNLNIGLVSTSSVICYGQANGIISFSSTPGYNTNIYSWNGMQSNDTIKNNLISGNYTIIATDGMGCTDSIHSVFINEPSQLTLSLTANDLSACQNQIINLQSTYGGGIQPYSVNISNNLLAINNTFNTSASVNYTTSTSTTFTASLKDKNNCTLSNTLSINVNPLPVVNFSSNVQEGCQPLAINFINLSATNPPIANFTWIFSPDLQSTISNPQVIFTQPGFYNVDLTAVSDSGCANKVTKLNFIKVYEKPKANFNAIAVAESEILNAEYEFTNLSSGSITNSFWQFGDGNSSQQFSPNHTFNEVGFYDVFLTVKTGENCLDTITKKIEIKDASVLWVPNAFTPNNNNSQNDVFKAKGMNIGKFTMLIFDRWGEKLFESNDIEQGWNGYYKGKICPIGTYIYKIVYQFNNGFNKGKSLEKVGHVSIVD